MGLCFSGYQKHKYNCLTICLEDCLAASYNYNYMNSRANYLRNYFVDHSTGSWFSSGKKSGFSKHAFREVPFGFRRGTVPGATLLPSPMLQKCPKTTPKNLLSLISASKIVFIF